MEYGGNVTGGLGGGGLGAALSIGGSSTIAALPNTGGSLRVVGIVALLSAFTGLVVLISSLARIISLRRA